MRDRDLEHPDITKALKWGYPYMPVDEEYEPEEVTLADTISYMLSVVEGLQGDIHDKEIITNLLEELEDKMQYPASTILRTMTDFYEDEIQEWKKESQGWIT